MSTMSARVPTPSGNLDAASLARQSKVTIAGLCECNYGCSRGFWVYGGLFFATGPTIEVVPSKL